MGSNKGGRPRLPKGVAKTRMIKADLSLLEYDTFEALFNESNYKTRSEFIRDTVLNGEIVSKVKPEFYAMARDLMGLSNNLNQIAHHANATGRLYEKKVIMAAVKEVTELLSKMKKLLL